MSKGPFFAVIKNQYSFPWAGMVEMIKSAPFIASRDDGSLSHKEVKRGLEFMIWKRS
jgi:hypothetical protein